MRIIRNSIIVLVLLAVILFVGINIFLGALGKSMICDRLRAQLREDVRIDSIFVLPPYSIHVNGFEIKDILSVRSLKIQPSISAFIFSLGGLNVLSLEGFHLDLVRETEQEFNVSAIVSRLQQMFPQGKQANKNIFFAKEAVIKNGEITYTDKVTGQSFSVRPLNCSVKTSLKDFRTRIELVAPFVSDKAKPLGQARIDGWLNFFAKDMDATATASLQDLAFFSPYFKEGLGKQIASGAVRLEADLNSKKNDLVIDCHLQADNILFAKNTQEASTQAGGVAFSFVAPFLSGGGGKFDFSIHTKFDRPRLEGLRFSGATFQIKPQNILEAVAHDKESREKIKEDFKEIGESFEEQFKDLKDRFEKF